MPYTEVMFSSATEEWSTPQDFFDKLNEEFNFDWDVCASEDNAKCSNFFTVHDDCLRLNWAPEMVYFMNPPYGREMPKFIKKAYEESLKGATVVCLLPARTDTKVWHEYCMKGEIRFIKGRLKFGGCKNSAPFPSAVVIFRGVK